MVTIGGVELRGNLTLGPMAGVTDFAFRGACRGLGAALTATDLRGGAAMIVAGLSAEGETVICDDGHVTRGYEHFDVRLRSLGADIYLEC